MKLSFYMLAAVLGAFGILGILRCLEVLLFGAPKFEALGGGLAIALFCLVGSWKCFVKARAS